VIIPYLRGYGTTRFSLNTTVRNGQPSALAVDLKDFLDALKIESRSSPLRWERDRQHLRGVWPERSKAMSL